MPMRLLTKLTTVLITVLAGGAGILALFGILHRPQAHIPAGLAGSYATVNGTRLRYVQAGSGPDVLLIHGSPGSIEDWEPVFERLARKHRVTAYDRPGQGYSEGWTLPHTPEMNGTIALGLIETLGLTDVLVVGHSYGGNTALNMALRNPEGIHGFVVVCSRAYAFPSTEPIYRLLGTPLVGRGFAVLASRFIGPSLIRDGVRASFSPNQDAIPSDFIERRTAIWTQPAVSTSLADERLTLDESLKAMAPHYREIHKRVDLVQGMSDRATLESGLRLAREIPRSRLVKLEQTGHYVQYARPEELLRVVDEALAPGS